MLKKTTSEIPAIAMDKPGFKGMKARFALTRDDGMPNYALRIMEFEPGGHTSRHAHAEEHQLKTSAPARCAWSAPSRSSQAATARPPLAKAAANIEPSPCSKAKAP